MTTAARSTWAPAKGGNEEGGARIFGASQKYSSRDVAAHTTLKPRREGQPTKEEVEKKNLRDELEERERIYFSSKDKFYSDDRYRRRGGQLLLEVSIQKGRSCAARKLPIGSNKEAVVGSYSSHPP